MDLNEFISLVKEQTYNDESKKITDVIVDFLLDVWDRDEKLTTIVHKKISPNVFPVVIIDIDESADLKKTDINAISKDKDWKPKKSDEVAFNRFCEIHFKSLKPLYDRFVEIS